MQNLESSFNYGFVSAIAQNHKLLIVKRSASNPCATDKGPQNF